MIELLLIRETTDWVILVAAVLAALGAILAAIVKTVRFLRKAEDFLGDWAGEEARPGVPRRPGVVERISNIEEQQQSNGGSSMRDAVDRVDERTAVIESLVRQHLEDGRNLLDVGLENDKNLWDSLRAAGIQIADYKPLDRDVLDRNSKLYDELFGQPDLFEDYDKPEPEPEPEA